MYEEDVGKVLHNEFSFIPLFLPPLLPSFLGIDDELSTAKQEVYEVHRKNKSMEQVRGREIGRERQS